MASIVADMQAVLEWRLSKGVDTAEYNAAKVFLDKMGEEISACAEVAVVPN